MGQRPESADLVSRGLPALLRSRILLPVALFVWFSFTAWIREFSLPDEGRYVGVAFEMLRSGNWLVPTLDTLPYFHKPPLFYWLTAAAMGAFGVNAWVARLPSLLAATGCTWAIYLFVRRWLDEARAGMSVLVLATTPFCFGAAQFANLDMLVAACIAATILCAADAVLAAQDGRPRRSSLIAAYVFAALGLLAKGLIGVVIPAMVLAAWLLVARPRMLLRLVSLPGLALFGIIAVPWFALMQARYPDFFQYFFVHHHFARFAGQGFNNPRPFWFSVAVFAAATLPWCALLAGALRKMPPTTHESCRSKEVLVLMWVWLLSTLLFFSIPRSKLIGYVLVAVPPLAVLVAEGVARWAPSPIAARRLALRMGAIGVLVCALLLAGALVRDRDDAVRIAAEIRPLMTPADEAVIVLRNYPFSLPFHLRRLQPIVVVEEWDQPWVTWKDSWRLELYDAAKFDPERGKSVLVRPAGLGLLLACAKRTVWLIGTVKAAAAWLPQPAGLELISERNGLGIWRKPKAGDSAPHPECAP